MGDAIGDIKGDPDREPGAERALLLVSLVVLRLPTDPVADSFRRGLLGAYL